MTTEINKFVFCGLTTLIRKHHIVPRCKGGKETVDSCEVCENWIHKQWSHNELRDVFNSVDVILANESFQKFLKWRRKQPSTTLFKSQPGKFRDKHKYR
jgi:5-methylcytosine-specific restriction protein A